MKKYAPFLLLIFFVFLSGCTMLGQKQPGGEEQPGQAIGVIIKSFRPDVSEIFSGDSVTFTVTVENVGEEDAENVRAKLIGLGTDWSGDIVDDPVKDIGDLPKKIEGSVGGAGDAQWDVTSPSDLKVDNTYTAGVIVYYEYKSTAHGKLKVISQNYIRTKPEEASQIYQSSGVEEFAITKAPIEISLAGAARPFVYRESDQEASVSVQLKNIGQGYPYWEKQGDRKVNVEKITINGEECLGKSFPQVVTIPIRGSYKTITCKFRVPEISEYTTIPIEVELSYNYYVESSSSIKVLKAI